MNGMAETFDAWARRGSSVKPQPTAKPPRCCARGYRSTMLERSPAAFRTCSSSTGWRRVRAICRRRTGAAARAIAAGLPWTVHDEVVRIDPGSVTSCRTKQSRHCLGSSNAIRPGDVVLDVGAFLGVYAIARRAGPARWTRHRVRADPVERRTRAAALRFNGPGPSGFSSSRPRCPIAHRARRLHRYDAHAMPYVNSLAAAVDTDAPSTTGDVSVVTIDDVCRELNVVPTIIRMDVQGAEIHALRGAERRSARPASVDGRRDASAVLGLVRRDGGGRAANG